MEAPSDVNPIAIICSEASLHFDDSGIQTPVGFETITPGLQKVSKENLKTESAYMESMVITNDIDIEEEIKKAGKEKGDEALFKALSISFYDKTSNTHRPLTHNPSANDHSNMLYGVNPGRSKQASSSNYRNNLKELNTKSPLKPKVEKTSATTPKPGKDLFPIQEKSNNPANNSGIISQLSAQKINIGTFVNNVRPGAQAQDSTIQPVRVFKDPSRQNLTPTRLQKSSPSKREKDQSNRFTNTVHKIKTIEINAKEGEDSPLDSTKPPSRDPLTGDKSPKMTATATSPRGNSLKSNITQMIKPNSATMTTKPSSAKLNSKPASNTSSTANSTTAIANPKGSTPKNLSNEPVHKVVQQKPQSAGGKPNPTQNRYASAKTSTKASAKNSQAGSASGSVDNKKGSANYANYAANMAKETQSKLQKNLETKLRQLDQSLNSPPVKQIQNVAKALEKNKPAQKIPAQREGNATLDAKKMKNSSSKKLSIDEQEKSRTDNKIYLKDFLNSSMALQGISTLRGVARGCETSTNKETEGYGDANNTISNIKFYIKSQLNNSTTRNARDGNPIKNEESFSYIKATKNFETEI